jgi:hypothetical protein
MSQLPAATLSANGSGGGILEFVSSVSPVSFTAPLKAGGTIDSANFLSLLGIAALVSYQ